MYSPVPGSGCPALLTGSVPVGVGVLRASVAVMRINLDAFRLLALNRQGRGDSGDRKFLGVSRCFPGGFPGWRWLRSVGFAVPAGDLTSASKRLSWKCGRPACPGLHGRRALNRAERREDARGGQ